MYRYCPSCKAHKCARKKIDLWKLPKILVLHLKRFGFSNRLLFREKIDNFVDFPLKNLDLTDYVKGPNTENTRYELFAVSNHYGGLGGGYRICLELTISAITLLLERELMTNGILLMMRDAHKLMKVLSNRKQLMYFSIQHKKKVKIECSFTLYSRQYSRFSSIHLKVLSSFCKQAAPSLQY